MATPTSFLDLLSGKLDGWTDVTPYQNDGTTRFGQHLFGGAKFFTGPDGKEYKVGSSEVYDPAVDYSLEGAPSPKKNYSLMQYTGDSPANGTPMYYFDENGNFTEQRGYDGNRSGGFFSNLIEDAAGWAGDMAPFILGSLGMYGLTAGLGSLVGGDLSGALAGGSDGMGTGDFGFDGIDTLGTGTYDAGLGNLADSGIVGSPFAPESVVTTMPGIGETTGTLAAATANTGAAGLSGAGAAAAAGGGLSSVLNKAGDYLKNEVSNIGLKDIIGAGIGLYGADKQSQAAQNTLGFMNNQLDYIKGYGLPGSPEAKWLEQQLAAKDAASGRNSQYGPRLQQLLGQLGQSKLNAVAGVMNGATQNAASAYNQDAASSSGLLATLGKMLGKNDQVTGSTLNTSSTTPKLPGYAGYMNGVYGNGYNGTDLLYG